MTKLYYYSVKAMKTSCLCKFRPHDKANQIPTCLIGCHSDRHWLVLAWVILGYSIHCPDFKCVIGVSEEVSDGDFGRLQAILLWSVVNSTPTGSTLAGITSSTFLANHIVRNVLAATCVLRTAPFQVHWGLIDVWNQVEGSRWWTWRRKGEKKNHIKNWNTLELLLFSRVQGRKM